MIGRLRAHLWRATRRHLTPEEVRSITPDDIRALPEIGPVRSVPLIEALRDIQTWPDDRIEDWQDPDRVRRREHVERLSMAFRTDGLTLDGLKTIIDDRRAEIVWRRCIQGQTFREIGATIGVSAARSQQLHQDGLTKLRRAIGYGRFWNEAQVSIAATSPRLHEEVFGEPYDAHVVERERRLPR